MASSPVHRVDVLLEAVARDELAAAEPLEPLDEVLVDEPVLDEVLELSALPVAELEDSDDFPAFPSEDFPLPAAARESVR